MREEKDFKEFSNSISEFAAAIVQWMTPHMANLKRVLDEISELPSFKALVATIESTAEERGISTDELISELGAARKLMGEFQSKYEWQLTLIEFVEKIEEKGEKNVSGHLG